ncbi:putative ankyrin repeat domain-containing protein [Helianthus debilis subsp. tardiflorus]
MATGADWSLQNENKWSALQEAVCNREEHIATIIARYYQLLAWAKWCLRLPRIISSVKRIRDFYMEITFHFESSIWKRGSSLRADMTLAGFDGFRIQWSDQTFLFLGDGYEDGKVSLPPGSLIVLYHKTKEITNALEGTGHSLQKPKWPMKFCANKVKAIRRLRKLLTTKLPQRMFPLEIAIPIVPTIKVLVTFTKFEELQSSSDEFSTPLSSPAHFQDAKTIKPGPFSRCENQTTGRAEFMDFMDERKPWRSIK